MSEIRDGDTRLIAELVEMLKVMLDQIDGDPLAMQFFDIRLIDRTKQLIAKAEAR